MGIILSETEVPHYNAVFMSSYFQWGSMWRLGTGKCQNPAINPNTAKPTVLYNRGRGGPNSQHITEAFGSIHHITSVLFLRTWMSYLWPLSITSLPYKEEAELGDLYSPAQSILVSNPGHGMTLTLPHGHTASWCLHSL